MQLGNRQLKKKKKTWSQVFENSRKQSIANTRAESLPSWGLKVKVKSLSRIRLCDPVDCSSPGSSVHGILQARILEWVAISFSRMLSFKPTFSLSSFTFIKRLFSYSLLSVISVVSSAYMRLFIFLMTFMIPSCASFSPAFLIKYTAQKLNKQGDNIQPWCTPLPIWNQFHDQF